MHYKPKLEVLKELHTSLSGLSNEEAKKRFQRYGPNEIKELKKITPLHILLSQFKNFLVLLLLFSALISYFLGEVLDSYAILIIVIMNAFFGFFQEYKAEKALEALKRIATPSCKVIRDGHEMLISSKELVPGDIILLEEGDVVPADAYLLEAMSLTVDESILTGESLPVRKKVCVLPKRTPIHERRNMVFMGTTITYGRGKAVVVSTGMETEFGKIAKLVQIEEGKTPLQKHLERLGRFLGLLVILICIFVFGLAVYEGGDLLESFELSVSLAVSAVPEGLPAVITLALTLGVQRMVRRNALMRRLSSVETLGVVDYICSDKTGTITKNEMTVRKILTFDQEFDVTGVGFSPKGEIIGKQGVVDVSSFPELEMLIRVARLCNNAHLIKHEGKWTVIGDPTEGALLVLAAKANLMEEDKKYIKVKEIFFDSTRKRMSTINSYLGKKYVMCKGAVESLLSVSKYVMVRGKVKKLDERMRREILKQGEKLARKAYRVLGFAYKEYKGGEPEGDLIFLGMVGMIDPPRPEVKEALRLCKEAGIRVMMITGDHRDTAIAIAKEVGLYGKKGRVVMGEEVERMKEEELDKIVEDIIICARASPQSKVRLVESLKRKGHRVAVTGDGINDAPALKGADIGVAVGSGTDVTKQASDMVILDDNFATIVAAIEEGRSIFDNIKKFVRFLLSANFDEIALVVTAFLMRLPSPFTPLQILWINLLTDGLPALALSAEPKDPDVMKSKPRDPNESIIRHLLKYSIFAGLLAFIIEVFLFFDELAVSPQYARTLVFSTSVFFEIFLVFSVRTEKRFYEAPMNKYLVLAVLISSLFQFLAIYHPFFSSILDTVPLSSHDWLLVFSACSVGLLILEAFKHKLIK